MINPDWDPYRVLGVDRDASTLEIARARRRLAKRHHPDLAGASTATDRMREVNEAWNILADRSARLDWDRSHPLTRDAAAWVSWPPRTPPPPVVTVPRQGGSGWWWTLAAVTVLLVVILAGGLIAALDGPSPGIRDSPVLQDNIDGP